MFKAGEKVLVNPDSTREVDSLMKWRDIPLTVVSYDTGYEGRPPDLYVESPDHIRISILYAVGVFSGRVYDYSDWFMPFHGVYWEDVISHV